MQFDVSYDKIRICTEKQVIVSGTVIIRIIAVRRSIGTGAHAGKIVFDRIRPGAGFVLPALGLVEVRPSVIGLHRQFGIEIIAVEQRRYPVRIRCLRHRQRSIYGKRFEHYGSAPRISGGIFKHRDRHAPVVASLRRVDCNPVRIRYRLPVPVHIKRDSIGSALEAELHVFASQFDFRKGRYRIFLA